MSRNIILTLATAATIAIASLASSSADARGFGGGGGRGFGGGGHFAGGHVSGRSGGSRLTSVLNPGRGGHPGHPGHPGHWTGHHHGHWVFRHGIWIDIDGVDGVDDVVDEAPATPGPCTCLTKTYTTDGLVVFADVCTKEAASARVDGSATDATPVLPLDSKASDATQAPTPPVDGNAANVTQAPTSPNYAGRTFKDFLAANAQAAQKN